MYSVLRGSGFSTLFKLSLGDPIVIMGDLIILMENVESNEHVLVLYCRLKDHLFVLILERYCKSLQSVVNLTRSE